MRADEPVLVEFSGGLDSSLVLSAATRAARRAGWPDPLPVTYRFAAPRTEERSYQELVISHLGLSNWRVFDLTDEHDLIGPDALQTLADTGLLMPAPLVGKSWSLSRLDGHTMLNGEGGDAVFGPRRITNARLLVRRLRHRQLGAATRSAASFLVDISPRPLRVRKIARELYDQYGPPWIEPALRAAIAARSSVDEAAEPLDPRRHGAYLLSTSAVWVLQHNARLLRARFGVELHSPLLEPSFLAAVDATVARHHWTNRNDVMQRHFAALLPMQILGRTSKAEFSGAYFAGHSRRFAERWDGRGLPDTVDAAWLKHHWRTDDMIHAGSALLLQRAALAAVRGETS